MRTLLVSGNDTGIGKTWAVGALGRFLCDLGHTVQIVKPVETGCISNAESDADQALRRCGSKQASSVVLRKYAAPLAPLCASKAEGAAFHVDELVAEVRCLPEADFRIVEGAGSLAVPLDGGGRDWTDFAKAIGAEKVVLVVEDRLGAIGQARMVHAFAKQAGLDAGILLNQFRPVDASTRRSNFETLEALGVPIWARQEEGDVPVEILVSFVG